MTVGSWDYEVIGRTFQGHEVLVGNRETLEEAKDLAETAYRYTLSFASVYVENYEFRIVYRITTGTNSDADRVRRNSICVEVNWMREGF
jgi:hypothetical protein